MIVKTPTEIGLQKAIDADPGNVFLKEVLADYLEEIGDHRAEGYRVLGEHRLQSEPECSRWLVRWVSDPHNLWKECYCLPELWHKRLPTAKDRWEIRGSREQADDDAAIAWSELEQDEKDHCISQLIANPVPKE